MLKYLPKEIIEAFNALAEHRVMIWRWLLLHPKICLQSYIPLFRLIWVFPERDFSQEHTV